MLKQCIYTLLFAYKYIEMFTKNAIVLGLGAMLLSSTAWATQELPISTTVCVQEDSIQAIVNASIAYVQSGELRSTNAWIAFKRELKATQMNDAPLIIRTLEMQAAGAGRDTEVINLIKTYPLIGTTVIPIVMAEMEGEE